MMSMVRANCSLYGRLSTLKSPTNLNTSCRLTRILNVSQSSNEVAHSIQGDSRIRFLPGHVADDDIQLYMNACDVVDLPYRRILGSGTAVLAMSFRQTSSYPALVALPISV